MPKVLCYDDDARRLTDPSYFYNKGSFAQVTDGLNIELQKLGMLGTEADAEYVGFASGIKLDFGFHDRKRFHIGVFETNVLPDFILNWARTTNTKVLGLSQQVRDVYASYGLDVPVVNIGTDPEFWKPMPEIKKFDKFTILSVTSLNFRSGINHTLRAFKMAADIDKNIRLIIKNTDERARMVREVVQNMRMDGYDIEYICERQTAFQVRELMAKSHLLAYNVINTSAGLPIVEAASMELPCIVGDFSPTNIYPSVEKIYCTQKPIAEVKGNLVGNWELPYTFAGLGIDENKAMINWLDEQDFALKLLKIKDNYDTYCNRAKECRKEILNKWTWAHSAEQLLKNINK